MTIGANDGCCVIFLIELSLDVNTIRPSRTTTSITSVEISIFAKLKILSESIGLVSVEIISFLLLLLLIIITTTSNNAVRISRITKLSTATTGNTSIRRFFTGTR